MKSRIVLVSVLLASLGVGCGKLVGKGNSVAKSELTTIPTIAYPVTALEYELPVTTLLCTSLNSETTATVVNTSKSDIEVDMTDNPIIEPETQNSEVFCLSDYEKELLAEVVEYEAGADWLGCYEKACCVAVIMNRVNQGCWGGDTIYSVLSCPNQFTDFYPGYCTPREGAYEAVDYYLNHPEEFSKEITGWYGDGYQNYFT